MEGVASYTTLRLVVDSDARQIATSIKGRIRNLRRIGYSNGGEAARNVVVIANHVIITTVIVVITTILPRGAARSIHTRGRRTESVVCKVCGTIGFAII